MIEAVSLEDLRAIAAKLIAAAKDGDIDAARLLLDRVLGKAVTPILLGETPAMDGAPAPASDSGVKIYIPDNGRDTPPRSMAEELARVYGDPAYIAWRRAQGLPPADSIPASAIGQTIANPGHVVSAASPEYRRFCEERGVTTVIYKGVEVIQRDDFFGNDAHDLQKRRNGHNNSHAIEG